MLPQLLLLASSALASRSSMGLITAARGGDLETVEKLLKEPDIDVNLQFSRGQWGALHEAALYGHSKVISALSGHSNSNVDIMTADGWSPLMLAAQAGKVECVKVLLAAGARTEQKDQRLGLTALQHAKEAGHTAVIQAFTGAGGREL